MNLDHNHFSGGDNEKIVQSQKSRKKNLQKKLTENDPFKQDESYNKVHKKKSQSILSRSNVGDKSQAKSHYSYQENDSGLKKEKNKSFVEDKKKSMSVSNTESEDEELKKYVREFKKKVEKKFNESIVNKNYYFPFNEDRAFDSEESIQSQMDIERYNLVDQNKPEQEEENDETEQLVDLQQEIGQLDKGVLKNELKYVFMFKNIQ